MHVSTIRPEHSTALTAWHPGACIESAKLRGLLPEKERTSGNRGECREHGVNYKFSFPKKPKYRKEEQEQEGQKLKRRFGALSVDMRAIYSIQREQDDAQRLVICIPCQEEQSGHPNLLDIKIDKDMLDRLGE